MLLRPLSFSGVVAIILFFFYIRHYQYGLQLIKTPTPKQCPEPVNAANQSMVTVETATSERVYSINSQTSNATLGFGGILAVNLPSRSDRRDVLTLAAMHTDIKVEWVDAVRGEDMGPKEIPLHWNISAHTMGILGSWRSQLNALRRTIDSGWETTLILEDDVDWDINLKSQMELVANKTRTLSNTRQKDPSTHLTSTTPTTNPYGPSWDLLWLGACTNPPGPPDSELFPGEDGSQAHWVYYAPGGLSCNWAYAITRASAKSLLAYMQDLDEAFDHALSRWCEANDCIVVWPELFGSFRPLGGGTKGSDNVDESVEDNEEREGGWTRNVVHSVTLGILEMFGRRAPWSGP